MSTKNDLVEAATELLDRGGEAAVTLRGVGQAVGVSHNAPYKHFQDRNALLAAVATRDFVALRDRIEAIQGGKSGPKSKLLKALDSFTQFAERHPNRYKLLFHDPAIAAEHGALEEAALDTFRVFAGIVKECQEANLLTHGDATQIAGLIYASVHGIIDLAASGRVRREHGFTSVSRSVKSLLEVFSAPNAQPQKGSL